MTTRLFIFITGLFITFFAQQGAAQAVDCAELTSQADLSINQVEARLMQGGSLWWDGRDGKYIVPKPAPGEEEVSAIFAGGLWIGGLDDAGNLKMAAQTYNQGGLDFWPGPIVDGGVIGGDCSNWDLHFEVYGHEIEALINDFEDNGVIDLPVAQNLLGWPGRGNPHFTNIYPFSLPDQKLAPFYDNNSDNIYNPYDGDHPRLPISCLEDNKYADQMTWWVFNDIADEHKSSNGDPLGLEVQAMAYGFADINGLEYTTFYTYDLINKSGTNLNDVYFGQWVDPDLGCWDNDFVGCNVDRSLAIVYNDSIDIDCQNFSAGYGEKPPMLGVDFLRGPKDENGAEVAMSSFLYYNGDASPQGNANWPIEYYRFLKGEWRDGSPIEYGGNGYQQGTYPYPYMFPDAPDDPDGWSECALGNSSDDRRFVMSVGPFPLVAGANNQVTVGVIFVPEVEVVPDDDMGPGCPSFDLITQSDDLVQTIFDNCFSPMVHRLSAPDLDIIELDQEIIVSFSSLDENEINLCAYGEPSGFIPPGVENSEYNFQGYILYQLADPDVKINEFKDPDKARVAAITDIKDGVDKIYNYYKSDTDGLFYPELMVESDDQGLQQTFRITSDLFAPGDSKLVNHKKYYFSAISYAYNNYSQFDPHQPYRNGQTIQYIQSNINVQPYTAIPHMIPPEQYEVNSVFGYEPPITRVDGIGNPGRLLQLSEKSEAEILDAGVAGRITYKEKQGPFTIKVYNPLKVKDGNYQLRLVDEAGSGTGLVPPINWVLSDLDNPANQWSSAHPIVEGAYEFPIEDLGISIAMAQHEKAGLNPENGNGFITGTVSYEEETTPWYNAVPDQGGASYLNYIRTDLAEPDYDRDPKNEFSNIIDGSWMPYALTRFTRLPFDSALIERYISPSWSHPLQVQVSIRNKLEQLNNVDIVLTPDKNLWSRCVVINTLSRLHELEALTNTGSSAPFGIRTDASIDKDGLPDNDGTGMSWFPGYAIDVETGERLNLFFGENSYYNANEAGLIGITESNGKDMIWNPGSTILELPNTSLVGIPAGGQHFVYVTNERYDECATIRQGLNGSDLQNIGVWEKVKWASFPLLTPGAAFKSMKDGLVPSEVRFELRVDNPFQLYEATGEEQGFPVYEFSIEGMEINPLAQAAGVPEIMDKIQAVPNPYYGASGYETNVHEPIVKITNLPAKCTVTIYSLDGKMVRRFDRNEPIASSFDDLRADQITTSISWDLKSENGNEVSSGVFLIHISSEYGERVLKWFGATRMAGK